MDPSPVSKDPKDPENMDHTVVVYNHTNFEEASLLPDNSNKGDGYWKVISDWSSCTVACGGGTQT